MLESRRLGAVMKSESDVSRRSSSTIVHARCAGTLYCRNLTWFSVLDFIKNVKQAVDKKFIEVYSICAKNCYNRLRLES